MPDWGLGTAVAYLDLTPYSAFLSRQHTLFVSPDPPAGVAGYLMPQSYLIVWCAAALSLSGVALAPAAGAEAEESSGGAARNSGLTLAGPLLGYARAASLSAIEPLLGLPGAAFAGEPIVLPSRMRDLAVSSQRDFALGVRESSRQALLYRLHPLASKPVGVRVSPEESAWHSVALSPTGSSAVLFGGEAGAAALLRGLPSAPELLRSIVLPSKDLIGKPAVRDDAGELLAAVRGGPGRGQVVSYRGAAPPREIYAGGDDLHIRFEPRGSRALVTDRRRGEVWLLSGSGQIRKVADSAQSQGGHPPLEAAFSGDAIVVIYSDGRVVIERVSRSGRQELQCRCRPSGLTALREPDLFQVSDGPGAAAVVRVDLTNPLLFLVAREQSPAEQASPPVPLRARIRR